MAVNASLPHHPGTLVRASDAAFALLTPPDLSPAAPLPPQTAAVLTKLAASRQLSLVGVSVWQARANPRVPRSSRLRRYNAAFLSLCDAVTFKDSSPPSVLVMQPLFLSAETEERVRNSDARVMYIVDAMHSGALDYATSLYCHVSRVGRLTMALVEVFAVRDAERGGRLIDYIALETPLCAAMLLPAVRSPSDDIPHNLRGTTEQRRAQTSGLCASPSGRFTWNLRDSPVWRPYEAAKCKTRASKPFRCMHCGCSETTQTRYAALA